jgi:hypothetical protein
MCNSGRSPDTSRTQEVLKYQPFAKAPGRDEIAKPAVTLAGAVAICYLLCR